MLDIVRSYKELLLCHQEDHISFTQYLVDFKARTEVVTGVGGKPGHHIASVNLANTDQCFEIDILTTEVSK